MGCYLCLLHYGQAVATRSKRGGVLVALFREMIAKSKYTKDSGDLLPKKYKVIIK